MATATQQTSATIIPFPRRPVLTVGNARGSKPSSDVRQALAAPTIYGGSWYHEEAIREARSELKS